MKNAHSDTSISPKTLEVSQLLLQSVCGDAKHSKRLAASDFAGYISEPYDFDNFDRDSYFCSELLSKFPFNLGFDRTLIALEKFHSIESSLHSSDFNLKKAISSGGIADPDFHWVFHSMKVKIEKALGPFSWDLAESYFGFGPGASVEVPRRVSQVPNKFGKIKPTVTQNCLDLAVAAVCSNSVWRDFHTSVSGLDPELWFTIVPGNKVVTVPKNAKTERTIAIEPCMNMYIQKGIGGLIRRRLKRVGVDLDDQTSNQRLALQGSLTGSLATLDLSSASDSVSWFMIQSLLPTAWVSAIEMCRSSRGVLPDGSSIFYRKVSSMGNGFTFELESLVFWALCSSVIDYLELEDRTLGVYGDDLIVSVHAVDLLTRILSILGFCLNPKKSHSSGGFRESCGKHYFHGSDVTPFYIRENIDGASSLTLIANHIRAFAFHRLGGCYGLDPRLELVWNTVVNSIPTRRLHYGPLWIESQLSDICVGVDFDEFCPPRAPFGLEGWRIKTLQKRQGDSRHDHLGTLCAFVDLSRSCPLPEAFQLKKEARLPLSITKTDRGLRSSLTLVRLWPGTGRWLRP